jgi:hypothetical protein
MPRYDNYEDFMADLDRSGLSDDPFGADLHEALSDEDLALIGGGRKPAPKPRARRAAPKPRSKRKA